MTTAELVGYALVTALLFGLTVGYALGQSVERWRFRTRPWARRIW